MREERREGMREGRREGMREGRREEMREGWIGRESGRNGRGRRERET